MSNLILLEFIFAGLLLLLAVAAIFLSQNHEVKEKVIHNFSRAAQITIGHDTTQTQPTELTALQRLIRRAGITPKTWQIWLVIAAILLLTVLAGTFSNWWLALIVPFSAAVILNFWLWHLGQKRIKLIISQLPLFIDQVIRSLSVGKNMEGAFASAVKESQDPIKSVFERSIKLSALGVDFSQSIQETADLYRIEELNLISLVIRVNRFYGSSVQHLLESTVKMIHAREAARRELRTLTGETRVTAWVLGLLPSAVALYIIAVSPGYLDVMLDDSSGRILLMTALAFQVFGGLLLWRMIKSI